MANREIPVHSSTSLIKEAGLDSLPFNLDIQKIFRGILRHIPLILIATILSTALGAYFSYRLMHTYYTQSVLIYSQQQPRSGESRYEILHLTLPSAVEMVTLPIHLKAVKSILGLDLTIEQMKEMISVSLPARDSNLVAINVTANNPNLAIDIANTLANVVVKSTQDLNQKQWQAAYSYFKNQEISLRQKLDEQSKELADYRREHRFMGMDIGSSSSLESLRDAESKLQTANLEYTRLLIEYENMNREFSKIPERIALPAAENSLLKSRLLQLESALLDARTKYAPDNPKIKALEEQLDKLKKSAEQTDTSQDKSKEAEGVIYQQNPLRERVNIDLITMQAKLRAAQKLKEDIAGIVDAYKEQVKNWSDEQSTFAKLLDRKTSLETQIRSNEQTQRMIEVMLNLGKGDLEMYQAADKAFSYQQSIWVELLPLLAFALGSCLGVGLAFIAEITDRKIRTPRQCELAYNIPCIETVPEWRLLWKKNAEKKTLYYVRQLAERLKLLGPFSSVSFTSSVSGEGKTSWAYHMAVYYASLGKKVLLLELDPRPNPYVGEDMQAPAFIENYLQGESSLEDIIYHGKPDRIKAGDHPQMKELLSSDAMQRLWGALKQTYDLILIDAPGIIEDDFGVNAARLGDLCLFVIGSNKVKKNYIDTSLKEIEIHGIRPVGIILNRVLPIYVDNLRASAYGRQNRMRFFERLFQRKPPD